MQSTGTPKQARPAEFRRLKSGRGLVILWEDGSRSELETAALRRASRAAGEIRRAARGIDLHPAPELEIVGMELVGNYAIRLSFSDGHDRGIYPFPYLRELAAAARQGR